MQASAVTAEPGISFSGSASPLSKESERTEPRHTFSEVLSSETENDDDVEGDPPPEQAEETDMDDSATSDDRGNPAQGAENPVQAFDPMSESSSEEVPPRTVANLPEHAGLQSGQGVDRKAPEPDRSDHARPKAEIGQSDGGGNVDKGLEKIAKSDDHHRGAAENSTNMPKPPDASERRSLPDALQVSRGLAVPAKLGGEETPLVGQPERGRPEPGPRADAVLLSGPAGRTRAFPVADQTEITGGKPGDTNQPLPPVGVTGAAEFELYSERRAAESQELIHGDGVVRKAGVGPDLVAAPRRVDANPFVTGLSVFMKSLTDRSQIGEIGDSFLLGDGIADPGHVLSSGNRAVEGTGRADTVRTAAFQAAETLIRTGERQTEISMNPKELGKVKMSLTTTETGVCLHIVAERAETQDLLRRHIDQLHTEFRRQGFDDITFDFGGSETDGRAGNGDPVELREAEMARDLAIGEPPLDSGIEAAVSTGLDMRL